MSRPFRSALAQAAYDRAGRQVRPANYRVWTPEDEALLRLRYPHESASVLAVVLGRATHAIHRKARQMGLSKSGEFLSGAQARRLDGSQGVGFCFEKGHRPWNKGLKGACCGGEETQFKPGQKPRNWLPIGSLRLSNEGYLQRKMTDTGYPPRDWVCEHTLLWVEAFGPVPDGHCLSFRDGNKQHITLDNLELITRAERMRRNTIHRYPPELRDAIRILGRLKRTLKEASREEQA